MPVSPTYPPLTMRQEGRDVRVTTARLNFLFPDSVAHNIGEAYDRLILKADGHFAPRWKAHAGDNISPGVFHDILQEISLHWMYFCALNRLPLQIAESDWAHPQTRRIIQAGVERSFQRGSQEAMELCANLMGLSKDEYLSWFEMEQWFLSIW